MKRYLAIATFTLHVAVDADDPNDITFDDVAAALENDYGRYVEVEVANLSDFEIAHEVT